MVPMQQKFALFFAMVGPSQVAFSLFLSPMAALSARNRETISDAVFRSALKYKRPSQRGHVLKAGYILASEAADVGFWRIGRKLLPAIAKKFAAHSRCPVCGPLAICLFGRLVIVSKNENLDHNLFVQYHEAFLAASRPTFAASLFLCNVLAPRLPIIVQTLLRAEFVTPGIVTAIDTVFWECKGQLSGEKREVFEVESFEAFQQFFRKFTTRETSELLYRLSARNADPASFFFARLLNTTSNFLILYAFLSESFKQQTDQAKANVRVVICASHYAPASRAVAVKLIAGQAGDDRTFCLALAGAETDDIETVRQCVARDVQNA
jgi:hypothetical protein